jgi:hypothetical protein
MIKATYISDGTFTLMPEYDELIQYSFDKEQFTANANVLSEVDLDDAFSCPDFQADRKAYYELHKHDKEY